MSAHVIVNQSAPRRSRQRANKIVRALRARGDRVTVVSGNTPERTSSALRRAVERNEIERLVIAGGDGLVNLAIQHVARTNIAVAICPIGSGNDFARAIEERIAEQDRRALSTDLIRITLPTGETRWAASVVIAGFPAAVNARANQMNRLFGSAIYVISAVRELPHFDRRSIDLVIDGVNVSTDTAMMAIGSTKYFGGGMLPCPDAQPDDHLLHFTSIEGVGRRGLLPHLIGRTGGTLDRDEVRRQIATRIEVRAPDEPLWADGEPVGISPCTFEVVPDALRIEQLVDANA